MGKNADYWRGRFSILKDAAFNQSEQTIQSVERMYIDAQLSVQKELEAWYGRFAANNQISLADARKMLNTGQLEEFRWIVDQYIQAGKAAAVDPAWLKKLENASARVHISRLEALQMQIQQQVELLNGNQVDSIDALLKNIVGSNYTHTAYEIQKGLGIGWDLTGLDQRKLEALISRPWTTDGRTFRDRCWTNKTDLVNTLNREMVQGMLRGDSPEKAIQATQKQFGVSRYKARRLIHTETSYFNACSTCEAYKDLDVEQIEILETLDGRTCEVCGGLDGKVIKLSEYEPGITVPPFHPNCRGTTCPHYGDMDGERAARSAEGKVYYVPTNMTYQDWKASFVDGGSKDGLTLAVTSDIIDKIRVGFETPELLVRHYEKHQEEFGGISEKEYLERANRFIQEPQSEDVEQLTRGDGSTSKYKLSTNEFIVLNADGTIRTYFLPKDKEEYWRYEHKRNQ
ncbi:MAG: minor capsid protein [Chaetfec virus UA24_244]|nr:MAG: minor capsid protein [Chaetfec virus UA24_244]